MVRIKIGGTCDPLEPLLMQLVQDWDELERWAFRYYSTDEIEKTFPGKKLTRSRRVRALAKKRPLPLWKKMLNKYAL